MQFHFFSDSCLPKLEVDPSVLKEVDFGNIVGEKAKTTHGRTGVKQTIVAEMNDEEFVDDPNVPPLI